ncbi:MAG: hypothetical protein JXB34_15455 [Bacteroidales bacterium]|nr:hypothetical protein [Bacteroidales bacterium]
MFMKEMLKHLKHNEIDKELWDSCVQQSSNSFIYAYSWYLDIISPAWEALVFDDYKAVMPLPVKKKFGIKYLYQPWFAQQLGVFSEEVTIEYEVLLYYLKKFYPFGHLSINKNGIKQLEYRQITARRNLTLDLRPEYSTIAAAYSKNHLRNIAKAQDNRLTIVQDIAADDFFALYYTSGLDKKVGWTKNDMQILSTIISEARNRSMCGLYGVLSGNELIAAAFCLNDKKRLTYIFPVSSARGYQFNAQFVLIDFLIKKFSNLLMKFDFEGSSIEGIARFYKGFGATEEIFYSFNFFRGYFGRLICKKNNKT